MNAEQLNHMIKGKGFVAALDQSGGSTPKALELYGIPKSSYSSELEMYDLVHVMRTRLMTSTNFTAEYILGVIMFENTMERTVEEMPTAEYLWKHKTIVPFLKVDEGLDKPAHGAQLMKPIRGLNALLKRAVEKTIFGTKMRSFIQEADRVGIAKVAEQQFDIAKEILAFDLAPIIEPEISIASPSKSEAERMLKDQICKHLDTLPEEARVLLKLSLPDEPNLYEDLMDNPKIIRILALSGGYSQADATARLALNKGMVASFSRALVEGLTIDQTCEQFETTLDASLKTIYQASIT